MILYPPAKINLGLYVKSKRRDGFHSIQTLFYPLGLNDILECDYCTDPEGVGDTLSLSGIQIPGDLNDNLLLKACKLFREKVDLPFMNIHLHKRIPLGAGLGGGSADATYLLEGLNRFAGDVLSHIELSDIALQLGSDCPYFLMKGPAIGEGRGEILTKFDLQLTSYKFFLFSPGIHVSTKEAYQNVELFSGDTYLEDILLKGPKKWKGELVNSFESSVFSKFPDIEKLKNAIYDSGALYAAMSGSGSAVFGLFSQEPEMSDFLKMRLIWSETLQ